MSCLKVINTRAVAYVDSAGKKILAVQWDNQGVGSMTDAQFISVLINGEAYSDGNSGYTQMNTGSTSLGCEEPRIPGGLQPGQVKTIVVRVHCLNGQDLDSIPYSYEIPVLAQPVFVKGKGKNK